MTSTPARKQQRWRVDVGYVQRDFVPFVLERQLVHIRRQRGLPRSQWTADPVLQRARFCCIDRRDDAVTKELLFEISKLNSRRDCLLLAASLRFTSSRRGVATKLRNIISEKVSGASQERHSPLVEALRGNLIECGTGTYQMTINRHQIAARVERLATEADAHVADAGPFATVSVATEFIADLMALRTVDADKPGRNMRPWFAAAETAKDLAYIDGMLSADAALHCHLGPGARAGMSLVRAREPQLLAGCSDTGSEVIALCAALRAARSGEGGSLLAWMQPIDVEQALCEFSKYVRYAAGGVCGVGVFEPKTIVTERKRKADHY